MNIVIANIVHTHVLDDEEKRREERKKRIFHFLVDSAAKKINKDRRFECILEFLPQFFFARSLMGLCLLMNIFFLNLRE